MAQSVAIGEFGHVVFNRMHMAAHLLHVGPMRETLPPPQMFAVTPDGIPIAMQEYGTPTGQEIVFIHGLAGSHINWMEQVSSVVLQRYRVITYDLRGHGLSGKPDGVAYYAEGERWADELRAVIEAKQLKRPFLVGWSLGCVVITNYLAVYGDEDLAGVVYVNGIIELAPEFLKPHPELAGIGSQNLTRYLAALRFFLGLCFYQQPEPHTFALLYANAGMALPEAIRTVLAGVTMPAVETLAHPAVPTLYIYGDRDALLDARTPEHVHQLVPAAQAMMYHESGHSSFFEHASRFNHDLDSFVQASLTLSRQLSRVPEIRRERVNLERTH